MIHLRSIDRWLADHLFDRRRIFSVRLSDCIDEFGNTFGEKGTHLFIRALRQSREHERLKVILHEYYEQNRIKSVNQLVGRNIGHSTGDFFFLPWERGRVRPLDKFLASHKIGPTPQANLDAVVTRLINVVEYVGKRGYRPHLALDGYIRVIGVKDGDRLRYLIRDGQHRASVLSHLGKEFIRVCFNSDYWARSIFLDSLRRAFGRHKDKYKALGLISKENVHEWPHVQSGVISAEDALAVFDALYGKSFQGYT